MVMGRGEERGIVFIIKNIRTVANGFSSIANKRFGGQGFKAENAICI